MPSATTVTGNIVSAQEAQQNVSTYRRKMDASRWTPPVLKRVRDLQQERVHVFSVSPWGDTVCMAEWGTFQIPKCPEGQEYVEFLMPDGNAIPGVMMETYVQDETRNGWHEEEGREWAEKLLNNDNGIPTMFSRNRVGMFVAKGDKPTKAELAKANEELRGYMEARVMEAREWSTDPQKRQGITREVHWLSARRLNLADESWMAEQNPQGRKPCPLCGTFSAPGVIKCGSCKEYIFDHMAYAEMQKHQQAQMDVARKAV